MTGLFRKKIEKRCFPTIVKVVSLFVTFAWILTGWPAPGLKSKIPLLTQVAYAQVTQYTSGSGSYSAPSGTTSIIIELWGGGGGGAAGGGANGQGNGGGGGGGYVSKTTSSPSGSYSYSVGAAGAGGAKGASGDAGNNTIFNTTIIATGGSGGNYVSGGGGTGGIGGSGSGGDITYTGGTGGTGSTSYGGGGGGGAGSTQNGGSGSASTAGIGGSAYGGDGGAGYASTNGPGYAGNNYGGGGGSGTKLSVGGGGAGGLIQITAYTPPTVTTSSPSDITGTTATLNGEITATGYPETVTRRGFCYIEGTSGDCTTSDGVVYEDGSFTTGTYTRGLSGLTAGTGYRVRAYAVSSAGTGYGTTVQLTTSGSGINLSGTIYQSSNEALAYDCSGGNTRTILLKVNGSGSYSGTCDQNTGAWSVTGVSVSSGNTVYAYISGVTVAGNTVIVSDGSAQTNIPIIVDRVVLRDDVNGSITNSEITAGNTSDAEDLITVSGFDVTVGSSYETHIYTGDTLIPDGNFTTGKLHLVGNMDGSGQISVLTLTGSGTGPSTPLLIDGGTFTASNYTVFQGTSETDIPGTPSGATYTSLWLTPTLTAGTVYYLEATSANNDIWINPTAASSYSLSVNLGGEMTVGGTGTTIAGTTSGIGVLDTTASNYALTTGKIDIQSGGVLTANDSDIYLTGTSSTLFTKTGTFNYGTSNVYMQPVSGSPTLTSGAITFYDLTTNMSGQTGAAGGNITVNNNLLVDFGTLSIPSTYSLTVQGATDVYDSLSISSTGNQIFAGTTLIASGSTFTRSSASGTNTFTGLLTLEGGSTFTTSNNPSFILQGGLVNDGIFTSGTGTFTFNTNNQTLSGSSAITFGGDVAISGAITVQNSNAERVTITGDLTGSEAGSTYQNNANATTYFDGAVLTTGTLTATADPNYIYYSGFNEQTIKATTYHDLIVNNDQMQTKYAGSGTLTVNGDLTLGPNIGTGLFFDVATNDPNISVAGNVTIYSGYIFTSSDSPSATFNIDGNLTINSVGTFIAPAGTNDDSFTLGGNLTNNGTFNHNNGQITLDTTGTTQLAYSSATSFYQFSVLSASAGKNIQFDETDPTIIVNDITVQGANCGTGRIYLDSLVNDSPWEINIKTGATQDIDYTDLEDANGSISEVTPTADNSTETGTNTGWSVTEGVCLAQPMTNFEGVNLSGVNIN